MILALVGLIFIVAILAALDSDFYREYIDVSNSHTKSKVNHDKHKKSSKRHNHQNTDYHTGAPNLNLNPNPLHSSSSSSRLSKKVTHSSSSPSPTSKSKSLSLTNSLDNGNALASRSHTRKSNKIKTQNSNSNSTSTSSNAYNNNLHSQDSLSHSRSSSKIKSDPGPLPPYNPGSLEKVKKELFIKRAKKFSLDTQWTTRYTTRSNSMITRDLSISNMNGSLSDSHGYASSPGSGPLMLGPNTSNKFYEGQSPLPCPLPLTLPSRSNSDSSHSINSFQYSYNPHNFENDLNNNNNIIHLHKSHNNNKMNPLTSDRACIPALASGIVSGSGENDNLHHVRTRSLGEIPSNDHNLNHNHHNHSENGKPLPNEIPLSHTETLTPLTFQDSIGNPESSDSFGSLDNNHITDNNKNSTYDKTTNNPSTTSKQDNSKDINNSFSHPYYFSDPLASSLSSTIKENSPSQPYQPKLIPMKYNN